MYGEERRSTTLDRRGRRAKPEEVRGGTRSGQPNKAEPKGEKGEADEGDASGKATKTKRRRWPKGVLEAEGCPVWG